MGQVNYSKFSDGTTHTAAQHNSPLDNIVNEVNGNLDSTNLASNAVTTAKIADDAVTTAKLADGSVGQSALEDGAVGPDELTDDATFKLIGRETLASAADALSIDSLPSRKHLKVIISLIATGGTIGATAQLNDDSGSNYAHRRSDNFGAVNSTTSSSSWVVTTGTAADNKFTILEIYNDSSREKVSRMQALSNGGSGAGTAPDLRSEVQKWANTNAAISKIALTNTGTGDFAAGSEIVVLGHN